jgi:hypothetical protein
VAAILDLPEGAKPEEVLLLVDVTHHRVQMRIDNLQGSLMGLSNNLLAYVYPSPDVGPSAGQHEVHVYHRYVETVTGPLCWAPCSLFCWKGMRS